MKVNLPPGCAGFADGDQKWLAERGAGSYVTLDPADPMDALALKKLKNQDYASAGLVDAGPEKQFISDKRKQGRWCASCLFLGHAWMRECSKCHGPTVAEADMVLPPPPTDRNGARIL